MNCNGLDTGNSMARIRVCFSSQEYLFQGEKEALAESRHPFEVAAARTSGQLNLVFSLETVFLIAGIVFLNN